jgi:hypothetical protein
MTVQISNSITYQAQTFGIYRTSGPRLFEPKDYGLNPKCTSTAGYLGWMAEFVIADRLLLRDLLVFHNAGLPIKNRSPNGPAIQGVLPISPDSQLWEEFNCLYKNINIPIGFTGGLLIKGNVTEWVSSAKHRAFWMCRDVQELSFVDGKLESIADKSAIAQTVREQYIETGIMGYSVIQNNPSVLAWLNASFAFNYNLGQFS